MGIQILDCNVGYKLGTVGFVQERTKLRVVFVQGIKSGLQGFDILGTTGGEMIVTVPEFFGNLLQEGCQAVLTVDFIVGICAPFLKSTGRNVAWGAYDGY